MTAYWEPGTQYNYDAVVEYNGHKYKIIQPHRSQSDWTPDITPALWGRLQDGDAGHRGHHEHKGHQEHYQQAAPVQEEQATETQEERPQHWWESEHHKKQLEIGGGVFAGVAALAIGAGGYMAYKEHEKHKSQKQAEIVALTDWIRDAQARSDAFYQGRAEGPVSWVLNKGHIIPDGAIEGGRDEDGNVFYIARAFQEGGIHPGKASTATKQGGVVGFRRKAIDVDTYEILVGDSRAVLWVTHRKLGQPGSPRPIAGGHEDTGTLLYIAQAVRGRAIHPGKAGGQFAGAFITVDDDEVQVEEYNVLCYA